MSSGEEGKLNPAIKSMDVGVKYLKTVSVYPLSLADQIEMTSIIQTGIDTLAGPVKSEKNASVANISLEDVETVNSFISFIKDNITRFLTLVFDPKDKITPDDITNNQLSVLATLVFEMNYEGSIKNFSDLFERVSSLLPSKRSLPPSVENMEATD